MIVRGATTAPPGVERFTGWPKPALTFLKGLHRDNSKAYFDANREIYETAVKEPMIALLAELERDLGAGWASKVFRINRDLRFSKDKRPYNEHVSAYFMSSAHAAGHYLQLSHEGLYLASGTHEMASDQITRYRDAVAGKSGEKLAKIVSAIKQAGAELSQPSLKRVPSGYGADHPRGELLRMSSAMVHRNLKPGPWLQTGEALTRVREFWREAKPLAGWLDAQVGPSTAPQRTR